MSAQASLCDGPSIIVASSADAEQLANCQIYDGDIKIDSSASGIIQLNGIEQISGDLTCANASQLTAVSLPSLVNVAGSMGFYSNSFTSLSAPKIITLGNTLAIADCPSMSKISFPELFHIGGGLLISNNSNLEGIFGFPDLQDIVGALDLNGTFESVDLPSLLDVRGGSSVQTSSSNRTICDLFDTASDRGVIKGTYTCVTGDSGPDGNPSSPSNSLTSSSPTHSSSSSSPSSSSSSSGNQTNKGGNPRSGLSGGAIGGIVVAGVACLILALGLWWCCSRRRKKQKKPDRQQLVGNEISELPLHGHHEKADLPGSMTHPPGARKPELPGSPGFVAGGDNPELSRPHEQAPNKQPDESSQRTSEARTHLEARSESHAVPKMKSRIEGRAELSWDYYTPELEGSNVPELESDAKRA